jgi:TonB-linked SusC/RagA family outer membrane protein
MRKLLFLVAFLAAVSTGAFAQSTVSGKVNDPGGMGLPGVSILVKGTQIGTATQNDGSYTLSGVPQNAVLVYSFIGFSTQEIAVEGRKNIDVVLSEDQRQLDEVVVIAYGTAKKKDLTGAVTQLDSKGIQAQSNSTVTRALEGAVAGVQVAAIDGQPGIDMGIRLRGAGSTSQNSSNALVVIDGVPAEHANILSSLNPKDIESISVLKDAASTAVYGSRGANGVLMITTKKGAKGKTRVTFDGRWGVNYAGALRFDKITDPKDVYELAWQAIYNSVRYGVNGTASTNGTYSTNLQNPNMSHEDAAEFASSHLFDYVGSTENFQRNDLGNWMLYDVPGAVYTPTGSGSLASASMSGAYLVNTDGKINPNAKKLFEGGSYDDHFLEARLRQEYGLTASGGTDKVDYFTSLGYLEDPSYIKGSQFKRYNVRSNVNAQVYEWLKIGANIGYTNRTTQSPATRFGRNPGSATANVFRWINGQNQLISLYARDKDGNIKRNADGSQQFHIAQGDTYSPLGLTTQNLGNADLDKLLRDDRDTRVSSDLNLKGYATVKFLKDFSLTTNISYDKFNEVRTRYGNAGTGPHIANGGSFGKANQSVTVFNSQQLLNWARDFGKHSFSGMAGHEYYQYDLDLLNYSSSYGLIDGFLGYSNFVGRYTSGPNGTFAAPGGSLEKTAMESYFGRGTYIYDEKYYLEASLRRDGSSKFKHRSNRWGTFWSVGAGWRISSEPFMASTKNWLNDLKLRASYGVIGNQSGIANYSGYQTWNYSAVYTQSTAGTGIPQRYNLTQGAFVNDGLTWENTNTFDIGVDFSLWKRVYGTIDWYNKFTDNSVWNQPIPYSKGQTSIVRNSAGLRNRGVEVEVNVDVIRKKDLQWSIGLNGTHYTTVLTKVPAGIGSSALNGNWTAGVDGWAVNGGASTGEVSYLRGLSKDFYNLYFFRYGGVDQNTGLPTFYHKVTGADHDAGRFNDAAVGSDVKTTNHSLADRYEVGSALPKWIGGFNTSVKYKDFDLSVMLAYQLGGKFMSVEYANGLYQSGAIGRALSAELIGNTWTPENPNAKFPMAMYGNTNFTDGATIGSWRYTDMALFNASYLNVKNISIGYTVNPALLSKIKASSLRVYASADNVLMLSGHSGFDPRMSLVGGLEVGAYSYPYMSTVSMGVSLGF